eukprot:XP_022261539.1 transmembrane protein 138 isoform X5 [Canis lupus familiaris]
MRRRCDGTRGPAQTRRPRGPQSGGSAEARRVRGARGARGRHLLPGPTSGFRKPGRRPHDNRRRASEREESARAERVRRRESGSRSLRCRALVFKFLLLSYDLFVNSFSELLRMAPVIQLVLFITYAGKTPTALSGQMDFKRYLYSRD